MQELAQFKSIDFISSNATLMIDKNITRLKSINFISLNATLIIDKNIT